MRRRNLTFALTAALIPVAALRAQTWPDKPVRFVLSQPPGSGPDNVARLIGDRLGALWGQPVVIDNKPGGQNTIGAQAAARAAPDGSTFYFATTAALVTNAYLFKSLPYDPQKDFIPVAFIARSPFGLLVEANSPLRSLQAFVHKAKAEPGRLTLGNEGPRTFSGMISRVMAARLKIEPNQVPYASIAVATQNLLGGQVDAIVADLASTAALVRSGIALARGDVVAAGGRVRERADAGRVRASRLRDGRLVRDRCADGHADSRRAACQSRRQRRACRTCDGRADRGDRADRRCHHGCRPGERVPARRTSKLVCRHEGDRPAARMTSADA
jgi:hypothetical protein